MQHKIAENITRHIELEYTLKLIGSSEIAASMDSSPSNTSAGPEKQFL